MRFSWLFSAYQRLSVRAGGSKERSITKDAVHPLPSTISPSPPRSLKAQAHYYCHAGPAQTWHSLVHLIELDIPACLGIVWWHENAAAFFHDKNERPRQHLLGDLRAVLLRGTRSLWWWGLVGWHRGCQGKGASPDYRPGALPRR